MTTAIELIEAGVSGSGRFRFEPSGVEKTLAEVWTESERVARFVAARVGTGGRVGAFLSNTPACPATVFGAWRSGNALVSLPYPGRGADLVRYLEQVERMTTLSGVELILVDEAYRGLLPPLSTDVLTYQEAIELGGPPAPTEESGGLIQFTSGSLGRPKGVMLTGEALAANMTAIMDTSAGVLESGPNAMSWLPLSHDMGFVGMFLTCAAAMGSPKYLARSLVLQTPESFLADPSSWLRHCSTHRAALTTAPNFAFELSVRAAPLLRNVDLSAMRICITGAEKVQAGTLRRFVETFEPMGLPPEAICPAYGMAEAALAVTMVRAAEPWSEITLDRKALGAGQVQVVDAPARSAEPGPLGKLDEDWDDWDDETDDVTDESAVIRYVSNGPAVEGMEVRIAAADGQDVGEVQIRGASLFSDYLGADRVLTRDGWFPTRDLGFMVGGELYLVGRADETIIVAGQNHYAADIEQAVDHDLVRSGCLAAVPLETGFALLAEPALELEPDRLSKVCRELARISVRKAGVRPSMVGFVPRGRLPKTPSGKLQRLNLAAALTADQLETICAVWLEGSPR